MSKSHSFISTKSYLWPVIAIVSLCTNFGLIGWYFYLVNYNQLPLIQSQIQARCTDPGYTRLLDRIRDTATSSGLTEAEVAQNLKFAAASLCFKDYDSGKTIDLDSLKPVTD